MSLEKAGAIAEIDAWLREITPRPDRPIEVHTIELEARGTVTIGDLDERARLTLNALANVTTAAPSRSAMRRTFSDVRRSSFQARVGPT
jgi:hypothetical protein